MADSGYTPDVKEILKKQERGEALSPDEQAKLDDANKARDNENVTSDK